MVRAVPGGGGVRSQPVAAGLCARRAPAARDGRRYGACKGVGWPQAASDRARSLRRSSSMSLPRSVPLALALAFAAAAPLATQERPHEETAEVIEVEVPVNVIGRDGEPLRGLTLADFEILDEGRPQRIDRKSVV